LREPEEDDVKSHRRFRQLRRLGQLGDRRCVALGPS
jgi:hypothetical protein